MRQYIEKVWIKIPVWPEVNDRLAKACLQAHRDARTPFGVTAARIVELGLREFNRLRGVM